MRVYTKKVKMENAEEGVSVCKLPLDESWAYCYNNIVKNVHHIVNLHGGNFCIEANFELC